MSNPFDYLPDIGEAPDDGSEWEALSANPSSASVTNAWDDVAALLTPAQREAAMHSGSALVLAGAGTGKTSTLTASVVHKIEVERLPPSRLLVVTFTNKAAREMANRIHAALAPTPRPIGSGRFMGSARDSFAPPPRSQAFGRTSTSSTPTTAA